MWALNLSSYVSQVCIIPRVRQTKPPVRTIPRLVVSATNSDENYIGPLGRTILTAIESNPNATEVEEKPEISGSDVLWAVNKVAEKKTKRKKEKKRRTESLSSAGNRREEIDDVNDDDDVKPLVVKREWGVKLAEFEKLLTELYDAK